MKLTLTRSTPAGVLSVEETLTGPAYAADVVRQVEAALATAEADIAARHGGQLPAGSCQLPVNTGGSVSVSSTGNSELATGNCAPADGRALWAWAERAGLCKRLLELGRAAGFRAATRRDVFGWKSEDVQHVHHELLVKPVHPLRTIERGGEKK